MNIKLIVAVFCLTLSISGPASAKFAAVKVTLSGPGTGGPQVTKARGLMDSLWVATLDGEDRVRTERPESTGPGYLLEYTVGVGDANGSRNETISQTLYPLAEGGPVVFTGQGQKIDISFGPVRFDQGWFELPPDAVRKLRGLGLPDEPPATAPVALASPQLESSGSSMPLLWGLAAGFAGVGALAWRRSSRR